MRAVFFGVVVLSAAACSNIGHIYAAPGYEPQAPEAVKHIAVAAWAPADHAGAAPVIARVAADFVKLRKNYLVPEAMALTRGWSDVCKSRFPVEPAEPTQVEPATNLRSRDGVLVIRVLQSTVDKNNVSMRLSTELYRCADGALLWRAEGDGHASSVDANLKEMVANYTTEFGPDAARFAAPAFVILQDVLNALPDVILTDAEIEEKIDQG